MWDNVREKVNFAASEDLSKTHISNPRFGDDAESGLLVGRLASWERSMECLSLSQFVAH